jgi:hypothetical protein
MQALVGHPWTYWAELIFSWLSIGPYDLPVLYQKPILASYDSSDEIKLGIQQGLGWLRIFVFQAIYINIQCQPMIDNL